LPALTFRRAALARKPPGWLSGTVLAACFLTALPPLAAQAEPDGSEWLGPDLRVERITDDVWRHVSYEHLEQFGRTSGNGLVLVSEGSAALVDTPWTEAQTHALFDWASRAFGAKIEVVVVTHSHPDCMGGLTAAHEHGAVSYSSEATAELARRDGKTRPRHTFTDSMTVPFGRQFLTLEAVGPGHTTDNIVVWVPEASLLYGGCLVRSGSAASLGYTDEADLDRWPGTIRELARRYASARIVVPGHGPPGGLELLDHTLDLLGARSGSPTGR
jgi:metallo-beta-lactamase class B